MDHAYNLDDVCRVDSHDSREILALLSALFHEVPERTFIVLGTAADGKITVVARARFTDDTVETALHAVAQVARENDLQETSRFVLAVVGDIDASVSDTVKPRAGDRLTVDTVTELAERFIKQAAQGTGSTPITAYYFARTHAGVAFLNAGTAHTWYSSVVANIHASAFAAHEVAAGRPFALMSGAHHFVNEQSMTLLSQRWSITADDEAQVCTPRPALSDHCARERLHGETATRAVQSYLAAGSGTAGWLSSEDSATFEERCEIFENLVAAAESREGRDAMLLAYIHELDPGVTDLDAALHALLKSPDHTPCECVCPGGNLYFATRLPVVVLSHMRNLELSQVTGMGLLNLACNHALMAWWAGRVSEASTTVAEVLERDPGHAMGRCIAKMIERGVLPAWLERRISQTTQERPGTGVSASAA